jgi:hypothetical protein
MINNCLQKLRAENKANLQRDALTQGQFMQICDGIVAQNQPDHSNTPDKNLPI